MKRFQRFYNAGVAVLLSILIALLSACGNTNTVDNGKSTAANTQQNTTTETVSEKVDPLGKYEPSIDLTYGRINQATIKFNKGKSWDDNEWNDLFRDRLGINVKNAWIVDGNEAAVNKINISIASGDIPDMFRADASQLKKLVDANMVADLTEAYSKYASEDTKKLLTESGDDPIKSATFNGKLFALPETGSPYDFNPILFVRTDWLKKLQLKEPKTIDDVVAIAKAFTENDPDGNNKKDTFGLAVSKEITSGAAPSLTGFFNGFHAYPQVWIEDKDGKLVYGSIQPEMKPALQKLAQMYKDGLIDREFGVKDGSKVAESFAAGKLGMTYGPQWTPGWPLQDNKKNDKNAEWKPFPIVSSDNKPALSQLPVPVGNYLVVRNGYEHPEAAIKVMNLHIDINFVKKDQKLLTQYVGEDKIDLWQHSLIYPFPALKNSIAHRAVVAAMDSGDASKLDPEQKQYYDSIQKYLKEGDISGWNIERIFGKEGSFVVEDQYIKNNALISNKFFGAPTKTMNEKMSTLQQMELDMMTKIILGNQGIEAFDKFVDDWKKIGGDQITSEVNDWKNSR